MDNTVINNDKPKIGLKSKFSDDIFYADAEAMKLSDFFKEMLDDDCMGVMSDDEVIDVPKIKTNSLKLVIEFCEHYIDDPMGDIKKPLHSNKLSEHNVNDWYCNFIEKISVNELHDLLLSSNFLLIDPLVHLCSSKFAANIRGMNHDEIKTYVDMIKK